MKKIGVLLAVSSLPGKYGIGDFSTEAFQLLDILKENNINIWQILPLNPVGFANSPYQAFSSFAFDEIYISIDELRTLGLIGCFNKIKQKSHADFIEARKIKEKAIYLAFEKFRKNILNMHILDEFLNKNPYVDEFCEFLTLKEFNNNSSWDNWKIFKNDKIQDFKYNKLKHGFAQMMLFKQWNKIKQYAHRNKIKIIGDIPFYVGYDSSDVYFHKEAFLLNKENKPSCVAGVPPDYFSKDGQRWGNPIWNWDYLSKCDFKFLVDRIKVSSQLYDIVRLDHFRAFDSFWAIDSKCETAQEGQWCYPPGELFFKTLSKNYPNTSIIVEDLGDLRPEVLQLRDKFNFAGIREVEFTIFDDQFNNKKSERINQVFYTSTHDNETLVQWGANLKKTDKAKLKEKLNELGFKESNLCDNLIKYSLARKEKIIVINVTDILCLNKSFRMNSPGNIGNKNWTFKLKNFEKFKDRIKYLLN